ncbi:MAG: ATP-binding cassette domain-containing protein [Acetobacteraceae bacterium]
MNEPTLPEAPHRKNLSAPGAITFRSVDFGFHHGDAILHDVTFDVPQGSVTGLIGPSGAGKSTLLELMMRFYDPAKGQVLIGGVDLRELPTDQLTDQIALVSQDVFLCAESIEDNIRIGNPDASEETWRHAARLARVDALVAQWRHGWATQVGEGGCQLSGGERQRVTLVRALLKNAPILLLDEASSALDALNVAAFQDVVRRLRGKTTIMMITHQLETVMHADYLLTLRLVALLKVARPQIA